MGNSAFKELFGEYNPKDIARVVVEKPKVEKKNEEKPVPVKQKRNSKVLLISLLSVIVVSLTVIILLSLRRDSLNTPQQENDLTRSQIPNEIIIENALDSFMSKFLNSDYRVNGSGAFAYIYDDSEDGKEVKRNGVIALGKDDTYFKSGQMVLFDFDEDIKVSWDKYDRKNILFKNENQYFIVRDSSDYYYRYYVGQHILQDLVNDYLKNKEFIVQKSDSTWEWEWSFYTPVDYSERYTMKAEVVVDAETDFVTQIKLIDNDIDLCLYEFSFEKIENFELYDEILNDYEQVDEVDLKL